MKWYKSIASKNGFRKYIKIQIEEGSHYIGYSGSKPPTNG